MSDIYAFLVQTLVEKFEVAPESISETSSFADLDLDSLALVELLDTVQSYCGVPLDDTDVEGETTLADVIRLIDDKRAAG